MSIKADVSFDLNKHGEPLARLLIGGLNLNYDAELTINKASSDVKISTDRQSAVLTLTAPEAKSLKIIPTSDFLTTYLSESTPQVVATSSFNDDGSVGLKLTPLDAMDKPITVAFDFGYPDYSSK